MEGINVIKTKTANTERKKVWVHVQKFSLIHRGGGQSRGEPFPTLSNFSQSWHSKLFFPSTIYE